MRDDDMTDARAGRVFTDRRLHGLFEIGIAEGALAPEGHSLVEVIAPFFLQLRLALLGKLRLRFLNVRLGPSNAFRFAVCVCVCVLT